MNTKMYVFVTQFRVTHLLCLHIQMKSFTHNYIWVYSMWVFLECTKLYLGRNIHDLNQLISIDDYQTKLSLGFIPLDHNLYWRLPFLSLFSLSWVIHLADNNTWYIT